MTLLFAILVVCASAATTMAKNYSCGNKHQSVKMFNDPAFDIRIPCKWAAISGQYCGPYIITVTPGNKWLGDRYRLESMWFSVYLIDNPSEYWEGRTTNRKAVKFINYYNKPNERDLFDKKEGTLETRSLFDHGIDIDDGPFVTDKGKNFKVNFAPWDPKKTSPTDPQYRQASFNFTCYRDDVLNPYPKQICGDTTKGAVLNRANRQLNFSGTEEVKKRLTLYYDIFTNTQVTQVDPKCIKAVNIVTNSCKTEDRIINALGHCYDILGSPTHTTCITAYSCNPMDVFNDCLEWGCSGDTGFEKEFKEVCKRIGEATDMCWELRNPNGNLTEKIDNAGCYKDFLPIELPKKKKTNGK